MRGVVPWLRLVDGVREPGSADDLPAGGDDAEGADDRRDRDERSEDLLEIELRLVGRIELGDPGDERPIECDERGDLDEPVRLGVELGRKLESTQIGPGQGAQPLFRLGTSHGRRHLLRGPHELRLPIPSPIGLATEDIDGTGLIATPIANGSTSPIASPMIRFCSASRWLHHPEGVIGGSGSSTGAGSTSPPVWRLHVAAATRPTSRVGTIVRNR